MSNTKLSRHSSSSYRNHDNLNRIFLYLLGAWATVILVVRQINNNSELLWKSLSNPRISFEDKENQLVYRPVEVIQATENPQEELPVIYMITPTYNRLTQVADLTRLSNTLNNVPRLHWIVVEDAERISEKVNDVMMRSKVWRWTQIYAKSPPHALNPRNHRGINQRNTAIRKTLDLSRRESKGKGILYFGDDDNTYDIRLFDRMRDIKKVGIWAVAFSGGRRYERCTINRHTGNVNGWVTHYRPERPFAVDMAAFAINIAYMRIKIAEGAHVRFSHRVPGGQIETAFLTQLIKNKSMLEPKGNCTEVWVWHTRTHSRAVDRQPENEQPNMRINV